MKKLLLTLTVGLVAVNCLAQVNYTTKTMELELWNSTTCQGYSYQASIPVFTDTGAFLKAIQDSIIAVCQNTLEQNNYGYSISPPDFESFLHGQDCMGNRETVSIEFEEGLNTRDIFSFILRARWAAGGGGYAVRPKLHVFNLQIKGNKLIEIKQLCNPSDWPKVTSAAAKKIADELDRPGQVREFDSYLLSKEGVEFFVNVLHDGFRGYDHQAKLSWKELAPYLNKEGKALMKTIPSGM